MIQRGRRISRRGFLKSASVTGAALGLPAFIPGKALGMNNATAPSERIVMAGLGIGRRGGADLGCFLPNPDVQFVAICDVREERRQAVKAIIDAHNDNADCRMYADMHEILLRPDIDAFLIATGDRWHTMASITVAKAGKDMYCEKPCSMTIAESRALADTMQRYGRVYQAGTQRRSIENFMFAINLAHSGKLGKLQAVHANTRDDLTIKDWLPAEPEPGKDIVWWDRWLGPCPWRPYNSLYVQGRWRGYFDFHGGGILEWGSHTVDLCQAASQSDDTAPVLYEPDGVNCVAEYADGVKLVMRSTGWLGLGTCSVRFEGDEGWIETGDSGEIEVYPASLRGETTLLPSRGTDPTTHIRQFLDCVKTRGTTRANASVVAQSHVACHAAYISTQLGRKLEFNPVTEVFKDDEEANRMCSRALREPWRI